MSDAQHIVERYLAIWNATEDETRRELIDQTWSGEGTYLDPMFDATGPAGIDAMVAGFQQSFPGHRFRLSGTVDQHHDRIRFTWELVEPIGGTGIARGTDFGLIAPDGRLVAVTGFFDLLPEGLAVA